jgi:hypothetical protein
MIGRLLLAFAIAAAIGCSAPPPDATITQPLLPDTVTFPYVGQFMEQRCGTLDCHGSVYRNLRIYGDEGLRYSPADHPCVPDRTTPDEFSQDYGSVVGLQPEVMNQVMADHGADPERLDLLAKPMGLDAHKGLTLIVQGDDQYVCITSWLAGHTNEAACKRTLTQTSPTICTLTPDELFDAGTDGSH